MEAMDTCSLTVENSGETRGSNSDTPNDKMEEGDVIIRNENTEIDQTEQLLNAEDMVDGSMTKAAGSADSVPLDAVKSIDVGENVTKVEGEEGGLGESTLGGALQESRPVTYDSVFGTGISKGDAQQNDSTESLKSADGQDTIKPSTEDISRDNNESKPGALYELQSQDVNAVSENKKTHTNITMDMWEADFVERKTESDEGIEKDHGDEHNLNKTELNDTILVENEDIGQECDKGETKDIQKNNEGETTMDESVEQGALNTPSMSVIVDRKKLTNTPADLEDNSKTVKESRHPTVYSSQTQIQRLPSPLINGRKMFDTRIPRQQLIRTRIPPKFVRLATVTMLPRAKSTSRGPSLYYEEPRQPRKVITWDEATNARPPLRIDMEGPTPWSYSPRNKPLMETNAPSWTFGSKGQLERAGGSRTSWSKTWFQTPHVWYSKVDFVSDNSWPSPALYKKRPLLGPRQRTMTEAPSYSIGTRAEFSMVKPGSDKEPSPVDYDRYQADNLTLRRPPAFTHQFRREGTVLWGAVEKTPGPGTYTPRLSGIRPSGPAFTIRGIRREKSHLLGPFSPV